MLGSGAAYDIFQGGERGGIIKLLRTKRFKKCDPPLEFANRSFLCQPEQGLGVGMSLKKI